MRIRSIKPEFWSSDDIARLSWADRLLFIGLWSYVDDNGVGRDNEKLIMADLFPLEDNPRDTLASVSRGLQELCDGGQVDRYSVDGRPFLFINAWASHQRIDRPNKARYPLPTCGNAVPRDTLASSSRHPRETPLPGAGEQGSRGAEEQRKTPLSDKPDETGRFAEFWDAYDHKTGRKTAEAKWVLALKKPGVTADLLIEAATRYIESTKAQGKHPRYTKAPTTWLNGEHWNDAQLLAAPAPASRMGEHFALAQRLHAEEQQRQIGEFA